MIARIWKEAVRKHYDRFLVERDQFSTHYFVHTHIAPRDRDEVGDPGGE